MEREMYSPRHVTNPAVVLQPKSVKPIINMAESLEYDVLSMLKSEFATFRESMREDLQEFMCELVKRCDNGTMEQGTMDQWSRNPDNGTSPDDVHQGVHLQMVEEKQLSMSSEGTATSGPAHDSEGIETRAHSFGECTRVARLSKQSLASTDFATALSAPEVEAIMRGELTDRRGLTVAPDNWLSKLVHHRVFELTFRCSDCDKHADNRC